MITTLQEFREQLKVGDFFYTLRSALERPTVITGPHKILALCTPFEAYDYGYSSADLEEIRCVRYADGLNPCYAFIEDLTNIYHGVFLTKEEADTYLLKAREGGYPRKEL